jgi:hypothetical protein
MCIPFLQDSSEICQDQPPNAIEFGWVKAVVGAINNGLQPELADPSFTTDVDVGRLVTVETVKEETIRARNA